MFVFAEQSQDQDPVITLLVQVIALVVIPIFLTLLTHKAAWKNKQNELDAAWQNKLDELEKTEWYRRISSWEPMSQQVHLKRIDAYCDLIRFALHTTNACRRLTWEGAANNSKIKSQRINELEKARDILEDARGKSLLLLKQPLFEACRLFLTRTRVFQRAIQNDSLDKEQLKDSDKDITRILI